MKHNLNNMYFSEWHEEDWIIDSKGNLVLKE